MPRGKKLGGNRSYPCLDTTFKYSIHYVRTYCMDRVYDSNVLYGKERNTIMTQSEIQAIPEGIHTITPHLVVRDAGRAAEWYKEALGAQERGRVPLPGGKYMQIALWFGDSAVMLADEFSEAGILSPLAI